MNKREQQRERMKGRKTRGSFCAFPHAYFTSDQFAKLSPIAVKLLVDLFMQYKGTNNGDLCATWSLMRRRGWTSKSQLAQALKELQETGWIVRTRLGYINRAALYAVTFEGINECGGKLEEVQASPVPLNLWRLPEYQWVRPRSKRRITPKSLPCDTGQTAPQYGSMVNQSTHTLPHGTG
jgi:hypothetical protein